MADLNVLEDKINTVLKGETSRNALDFAAFLRENNITPAAHEGGGWSIMRGDDDIGFIIVDGAEQIPGPWTVWFNTCDFDDDGADNSLKETAWSHASVCAHFATNGKDCGCGNQPGFTRTIFGKEFKNRCHSPLMFTDPDAATLAHVKRLMLALK